MLKSRKTEGVMPKNHKKTQKFPFKNSKFLEKRQGKKADKSLKQIISGERYDLYPTSVATYLSIEAGPSILPAKKYCDISGHTSKYTDASSGLRYCTSDEYRIIKGLTLEHIESLLLLRKVRISLK